MKNYYKILGLPNNASKDAVKIAYRKLAMKYHPDKNEAKSAHEKFILINEAYAYLSDDRPTVKSWGISAQEAKAKIKEEELKKRMQWAKNYAHMKKIQEEQLAEITYDKIYSSSLGWIYQLVSWISIGLALLIFLDFKILTKHDVEVKFYRSYIDMVTQKEVILFKENTQNGKLMDEFAVAMSDISKLNFSKNVSYNCQKSPLFNELIYLTFYKQDGQEQIFNHYSVYEGFYIFFFLLLTPLITLLSKGRNFLHIFGVYVISGLSFLVIFFLLTSILS